MNMPYVTIYTDGSWRNTTKKGGWATLVVCGPHWKVISDVIVNTTIPRMELTSVIKGLQLLSMPCKVTVISDSQLIVNTINLWLDRWVSNGWKTYKGASVMNQDLLTTLYQLKQVHMVDAVWVRAHTKNKDIDSLGNAVVDEFAQIQTR